MGRRKITRAIVLVLLLCAVSFFLLSEAYVLTHARHSHEPFGCNDECRICANIQSVENLRRHFGAVAGVALLAWIGSLAVLAARYFIAALAAPETPVCLKIRLNN